MAVYYYLCYRLAPKVLIEKKGVFGAWHMHPFGSSKSKLEEEAQAFGMDYGSNPFSSAWWLQNWNKYTDLIQTLVSDKSIGLYCVSTDIANFYDSIEVPRLINGLRSSTPVDNNTIDALAAFLAYWNRRHVGYAPSSKGIPQEIVSDASRVLAHFYLQEFDGKFEAYCNLHSLTFTRWSDDILIFGSSRPKLESAIHEASRLLRDLGLNLNAAKTQIRTKKELSSYRALPFLKAVASKSVPNFNKEVQPIKKQLSPSHEIRIDTVFRAMIGFLTNHPTSRTSQNIALLQDIAQNNRDLVHSLNHTQILRYLRLMDDPKVAFGKLLTDICKARFGAPKASFLHMMRKYRSQLTAMGISNAMAKSAILRIEKCSDDSDVLKEFCIPFTLVAFGFDIP